MTEPRLPGDDQVGEVGTWTLPDGVYRAGKWQVRPNVALTGRLLGFGTSEVDSRPRWVEIRLFGTDSEYVVHISGCSRVPGERTWSRVDKRTASPDEVIESLVERRHGQPPRLAMPAQRALEQAAVEDESLREAYAEHRAAYLAAS